VRPALERSRPVAQLDTIPAAVVRAKSPSVVVESIALVYDDGGERVLLDAGAVTA